MKLILRVLAKLFFHFRAFNSGTLNTPGPVLLIPNHVSWLDWLFLYMLLDDDWKFVVSQSVAERSWLYHRVMVNNRTYPIDPTSPYSVKDMAKHLQKNGRLVLFAEGQITTTGSLMKLYEGTGFLLFKTKAKVVTCYLRGGCWSVPTFSRIVLPRGSTDDRSGSACSCLIRMRCPSRSSLYGRSARCPPSSTTRPAL